MPPAVPTLKTERLLLRPFELTDAASVQLLASAAEVAATTLELPHPYPEGAAEAWIATHVEAAMQGTGYTWAIVRSAGGVLLGAISLGIRAKHARGSLGYWLGLPYWNQGYMTEAARRVVTFGFEELRLHRIEASCFPRNVGSARVMQKAGLRYEGTLRGDVRKGDTFEDVAQYGLLRDDAVVW